MTASHHPRRFNAGRDISAVTLQSPSKLAAQVAGWGRGGRFNLHILATVLG
jgi:hypothetical protein